MADSSKRPFHCGSQFADWIDKNCEHCKKSGSCDIQHALGEAYMGDGSVTAEIAARMNYKDKVPGYYCWPCNEVESTTPEHAEAVRAWRAKPGLSMPLAKPHQLTLEDGHTYLPQYLGLPMHVADPRPNPRTRRAMSNEDDPARAKFVEEIKARYRKGEA